MERKNQMTRNKYWRKQKLVQKYITRLKKFPASNYGVITIINIGLYLINQQVLHVVVGYVRYNRRKFKEETKLEIEMF